MDKTRFRMQEFFAGSGLVALGLAEMFVPVWANDVSASKAAVYKANFGGESLCVRDIREVRGQDVPAAELSWASFPCQDLSLAGRMDGIGAARSGLVWEWLRVLDEMEEKPPVLAVENVTGLISGNGGAGMRALHEALTERGYASGAVVLDAARFVPQSRPRVFVVAVRSGVEIPQGLADTGPNWLHTPQAARLGSELDGWIWWRAREPEPRTTVLADLLEPDVPFDREADIALIPDRHRTRLDGGDCVAAGYRRTRGGRQSLELRFDGLAGCLRTPGGGSSRQQVVVRRNGRTRVRFLTPREAARLMGAPDTFALPGTTGDQLRAMGDAVAVPVARFLGESLLLPLATASAGKAAA